MSVSVLTSGTSTMTVGTLVALTTVTAAGCYVLGFNTTNIANGDALTAILQSKILSTDTVAQAYQANYVNAQTDIIKFSMPVPSTQQLIVQLKQTAGSARTIAWALYQL